jgi:hypothetical protein
VSKSVVFTTTSRIACAGQSNPTVILCLGDADLLASGRTTLEGTLTNVYRTGNDCSCPSWRYVVSYDESLLTTPATALTADDVTGIFCKSCLTTWVDDEINALGSGFKYVYPTTEPTAGQSLKVLSVSGTTITLEWA